MSPGAIPSGYNKMIFGPRQEQKVVSRRLFVITTGIYLDPTSVQIIDKYRLLSESFEGHVLWVSHQPDHRQVRIDRFLLDGIYLPRFVRMRSLLRNAFYLPFVFWKAIQMHFIRHQAIDLLIVTDAFKTGVVAWLLSRLLRTRFLVEVIGNHQASFRTASEASSVGNLIKHYLITRISPFILNRAHGVKLLYDTQVDGFAGLRDREKYSRFHDFTPVQRFHPSTADHRYILSLGYPWYLKGVDVLIKAFLRVAPEYPGYRLKVVGYSPDKSYFQALAGGNARIELCDAVYYDEVIRLISNCTCLVLASRTEAMGRVLLEAMAARKPVVASRVDGIPTYVQDGATGLLFRSGDDMDLAEKLSVILGDDMRREMLANEGFRYVRERLSEAAYLHAYTIMADAACARPR